MIKNESYYEQRSHIKVALIKKTLRETLGIVSNSLIKLTERGDDLIRMEEEAENLKETSEDFFFVTQPWYKTWWVCFCCSSKKKAKKKKTNVLISL